MHLPTADFGLGKYNLAQALTAVADQPTSATTPRNMMYQFYDITVPILDGTYTRVSGISLNRYLLADKFDSAIAKKIKKAAKAWAADAGNPKLYDQIRPLLTQVFDCKGLPNEYSVALAVAVYGNLCGPKPDEIQGFADDHLGLDCSGFVNAYFEAKGRLRRGHRGISISRYLKGVEQSIMDGDAKPKKGEQVAYPTQVHTSLSELKMDDCLIWMTSEGDVKRGYGHIALVQSVNVQNDTIEIVEATGPRKLGLRNAHYTIEGREHKGPGLMFHVDRPDKSNHSWVTAARLQW